MATEQFPSRTGRPFIDPELMIRMLIVGYCLGIRSERQSCEEVHLNLAYRVHEGTRTEGGWHLNIRVGVQYIEAYLLVEDTATAEISRAQIWQWLK